MAILDGCIIGSWAPPRFSKVKKENLGAVPLNDEPLGSGKPRELAWMEVDPTQGREKLLSWLNT